MPTDSKLLAWIEPVGDEACLVAFVSKATARDRAPATRLCASHDDARQWVDEEAAAIDLPVEWVTDAPKR